MEELDKTNRLLGEIDKSLININSNLYEGKKDIQIKIFNFKDFASYFTMENAICLFIQKEEVKFVDLKVTSDTDDFTIVLVYNLLEV